ncbi:hypothetical protein ACPC54_26905 [Kitasatospora sp. NPDC094028]
MTGRKGQIEALMAAFAGAVLALLARTLLNGAYDAHRDAYAVLKWLDGAVLLVGVVAAGLTYRLLRGRTHD